MRVERGEHHCCSASTSQKHADGIVKAVNNTTDFIDLVHDIFWNLSQRQHEQKEFQMPRHTWTHTHKVFEAKHAERLPIADLVDGMSCGLSPHGFTGI